MIIEITTFGPPLTAPNVIEIEENAWVDLPNDNTSIIEDVLHSEAVLLKEQTTLCKSFWKEVYCPYENKGANASMKMNLVQQK